MDSAARRRERGGGQDRKIEERKTERAIFLVDGEHYPPVTADAVRELAAQRGWEPCLLLFLGGAEKVAADSVPDFGGLPVRFPSDPAEGLEEALCELGPRAVVDLSDEPVMGQRLRLRLVSLTLRSGASYFGADFTFTPPLREALAEKPSIAVLGAGKRCGKTAVTAHLARWLAGREVPCAVVAMGRGGPPRPELLQPPPCGIDCGYLLDQLERGLHAASDYIEDALIAGVPTVGCRRCGAGMAGAPFVTNFREGVALADGLPVELLLLEGSGAAVPPVRADLNLLVVNADRPPEELLRGPGAYRLLISDAVIITMCEEPGADDRTIRRLEEGIRSARKDIEPVKTVFRPFPLKPVEGRKIFLTCTAPQHAASIMADHLEREEGCAVIGWSNALADRTRLRAELEAAGDFEVLLTELKAAAVDVAVRFAMQQGKEVVFLHNIPVAAEGEEEGKVEGLFAGLLHELRRARKGV